MRSLLLLALLGALFAAFLVRGHLRARGMLEREESALERLRVLAAGARGEPLTRGGYRFSWKDGLLVAGPLERGEDGVRWFATRDGKRIYEYDSVRFSAARGAPDTRRLQRFLAPDEAGRREAPKPYGWRLLAPTMDR